MVNEVSTYLPAPASAHTAQPLAVPASANNRGQVNQASSAEKTDQASPAIREQVASGAAAPETEALDVEQIVKDMKDYVQNVKRELEFSVDEESGRTIITVKDSETNEVIRQIPPEDLLYLVKALQKNSAHLFVEAKA